MQVFIATDLEGVGGVLLDEQVNGSSAAYERARRLLTQEVNAAVEGALAGAATEVPIIPGRERLDARTIAYRAENVIAALRLI